MLGYHRYLQISYLYSFYYRYYRYFYYVLLFHEQYYVHLTVHLLLQAFCQQLHLVQFSLSLIFLQYHSRHQDLSILRIGLLILTSIYTYLSDELLGLIFLGFLWLFFFVWLLIIHRGYAYYEVYQQVLR